MEEVSAIVRDFDDIFRHTHWPIMPLMLMHFILPFSPVCIAACCRQRRESQVKEAVAKWNAKLVPRGAHLEMAPSLVVLGVTHSGPFMYLVRHDDQGIHVVEAIEVTCESPLVVPSAPPMHKGDVPLAVVAQGMDGRG